MATTEEALVSVIAADAACQTHLGTNAERLYPETLAQGTQYPSATYQQIAGTRVNSYDGIDGLNNPLYQIDCYAKTRKTARELADAIRSALDADADLGAIVMSERSTYEDSIDPRLYRLSLDVSLWHGESS